MHCVTKKSHYVLDMENHLQEFLKQFNYFNLCLSLILYSKIVN